MTDLTHESPELLLAAALRRDAARHDAGEYAELSEEYDATEAAGLPFWPDDAARRRTLAIAFNFWDSWGDASRHDWQFYDGISRDDWPQLAREIAQALEQQLPITHPIIVRHFNWRPRPSLFARLRSWFS